MCSVLRSRIELSSQGPGDICLSKSDMPATHTQTCTNSRTTQIVTSRGEGGGLLPSKRLLGMCRWMGSHFHNWTDYNGVTFLVELLEWGRKFSGFLGQENSGKQVFKNRKIRGFKMVPAVVLIFN